MKIVVLGSGSWGCALAQVLADNHQSVTLYARKVSVANEINQLHTNKTYFGDTVLNDKIVATTSINCVCEADLLILSVPTQSIEEVCNQIDPLITKKMIIVNTAKGFNPGTNERMSEVIRRSITSDHLQSVVSLIGPSHAEEVILRLFTTVVSVSNDEESARFIQELFSNEYFRVYRGRDEIGSEYGGAIKNTIALASGILSGLGYGDNTKAALITRGLAEMIRFGIKNGGRQETFMGLTGMGDLIVTCMSVHSRNYQAGVQIGKADSATEFLENNHQTVEGIRTTKVLYELKNQQNISMPIVDEIYKVLYEHKQPSLSIQDLMLRELKPE